MIGKQRKKSIALQAVESLKALYPNAICSLTYEKPHELLFAVRLSAQCTDARVNLVTPALFEKYPTLQDFAEAELKDVEALIHSCGFYHAKAANLIDAAKMLLADFDGQIPNTMEDLLKLPGVGRKTANLILGDIYHQPCIVADTHCIRISGRLGLVESKDPYKVEMALRELIPPEEGSDFCHRIVLFGRDICDARKPLCDQCPMQSFCPKVGLHTKKNE